MISIDFLRSIKKYSPKTRTCRPRFFQPITHIIREALKLFNAVVAAALPCIVYIKKVVCDKWIGSRSKNVRDVR